eukprot:TRINITY_DN3425_c0_g1_i1.p1 TRINITY_DN3425_c0_g1~~TRINITY_DN3425_c0_g1_i1.p1  ORF type:complete len:248 (+),score=16.73 TRINITY_DN3425_c0_g1_i1:101-844(+)
MTDIKDLQLDSPAQLSHCIEKSIQIIQEALRRFQSEEMAVAFNGGKDCTVLLHLIHLAIARNRQEQELTHSSASEGSGNFSPPLKNSVSLHNVKGILMIYFDTPDAFPEEHEFTLQTKQRYGLNVLEIPCASIKEGLFKVPNRYKAIFMGSRSTDPHCEHLTPFSPTDTHKGWPDFVRICPVLHWSYKEIWNFIKTYDIPYCSLYDAGYTSIGAKGSTKPNPHLRVAEGKYEPAHSLLDDMKERDGR